MVADPAHLPISKACRQRAVQAIGHAGSIAMQYFRTDQKTYEKSPGQLVTEADLEIDRYLRETLPSTGEGWLSEETADSGHRLSCSRVWIVDPIDGTRSFARGDPEFAISVALADHEGALGGWLLNPATGEFLEAYRSAGAWLNGNRLVFGADCPLDQAEIVVSSGEDRKIGLDRILAPATIRPLGSVAYKLMDVAIGRSNGYVTFRSISDWDLAAGILLVEEAGAKVTDLDGHRHVLNRPNPKHHGIVAAGIGLHREIEDRLSSGRGRSSD